MASHQSYCKRYCEAHREAILASQRLRRQDPANRVRMREYYARYYLTNRERHPHAVTRPPTPAQTHTR